MCYITNRSADCSHSKNHYRLNGSPRMERVHNAQFCSILKSHLLKCAGQLLPRRSPAPGEVTVLSPCSCWYLAPLASHISSLHLDGTRCSWIISHTGESCFPFAAEPQIALHFFQFRHIKTCATTSAQIFLTFKNLLCSEGRWKKTKGRDTGEPFFPHSFHLPLLKNKTLTWSWKVACLKCITMSKKQMAV